MSSNDSRPENQPPNSLPQRRRASLPRRGLVERLLEQYNNHPGVSTLLQLAAPLLGSAIDATFREIYRHMRDRRLACFFAELAHEDVILTEKDTTSHEFIHRFLVLLSATQRTRNEDKIRYFARLLARGWASESRLGNDDFDELFAILDTLSIREFRLLVLLHDFESRTPREPDDTVLQWINRYWPAFVTRVHEVFGWAEEELYDRLARLTRTGCYRLVTGTYIEYLGDRGHTTPTFHRLQAVIRDRHQETEGK